MNKLLFSILLIGITFITISCNDDEPASEEVGVIEIEFDNIALVNGVQRQLSLVTPGSDDFNYTNGMGQDFNINLLRVLHYKH